MLCPFSQMQGDFGEPPRLGVVTEPSIRPPRYMALLWSPPEFPGREKHEMHRVLHYAQSSSTVHTHTWWGENTDSGTRTSMSFICLLSVRVSVLSTSPSAPWTPTSTQKKAGSSALSCFCHHPLGFSHRVFLQLWGFVIIIKYKWGKSLSAKLRCSTILQSEARGLHGLQPELGRDNDQLPCNPEFRSQKPE